MELTPLQKALMSKEQYEAEQERKKKRKQTWDAMTPEQKSKVRMRVITNPHASPKLKKLAVEKEAEYDSEL